MKILVIGSGGHVGGVAADTLTGRGHEVIRASRSTTPGVDITDPASISGLFETTGSVDAVVVAAGAAPFKPVTALEREDYLSGLMSKALGQIDVVRIGLEHVADGGSITLTTGILSREPIATGAAAATANGAVDAFVMSASAEAPRGIRINTVSPDVLENSPHYHAAFPGHRPVSDEEVGTAYVLAVEGVVNGRVITV